MPLISKFPFSNRKNLSAPLELRAPTSHPLMSHSFPSHIIFIPVLSMYLFLVLLTIWMEWLICWLVCGYPANPGSEASKHHLASRTLMSPSPRMSPSEICDFVFEDEKRKIWTRSGAECENLLSVYNCILPWPFGPIFHQKGRTLQSLPIDIFQPKAWYISTKSLINFNQKLDMFQPKTAFLKIHNSKILKYAFQCSLWLLCDWIWNKLT